MEIGIICPVSGLKKYAERSHYHLVLAHMIQRGGAYVDFYRKMAKRGDFITLDNSSFEIGDGHYTPSDLIRLANEVHAHEVMAPESFPHAAECCRLVWDFVEKFKSDPNVGKLGIFATAHGISYKELQSCVHQYLSNPHINTIGLSCRMDFPHKFLGLYADWNDSIRKAMLRATFVTNMQNTFRNAGKAVHLLGLNHPMELLFYQGRGMTFLRSNDSSAAYIAGKKRIFLDRLLYEKFPDKMNFDENCARLDQIQEDFILANIIFLQDIAR